MMTYKHSLMNGRRLLFFTGKGGVGKTTLLADYAKTIAKQRKKVCIVEHNSLGEFERLLSIQKTEDPDPKSEISLVELKTETNIEKYFEHNIAKTFFAKFFFQNKIIKSFLNSIPGLGELSFLGRLSHYIEFYQEIDVFLVDGFSSGHFYSLMKTPKGILKFGESGPLLRKISDTQKLLEDKTRTAVVYVTNPERVILEETTDFIRSLEEATNVHIDRIILNRYWSDVGAVNCSELGAHVQEYMQKKADDSLLFRSRLEQAFPKKDIFKSAESVHLGQPVFNHHGMG